MFGLSVEKLLVLAVVALFVLGPERLPAAAAWLGRAVRHVNGIISDAQNQLHSELGPEFNQLRQPLHELRSDLGELHALCNPRRTLTHNTSELGDDSSKPGYDLTPPSGPPIRDWQPVSRQAHQALIEAEPGQTITRSSAFELATAIRRPSAPDEAAR